MPGSVRLRTTLAATLIVAVTLSVGAAVLLHRFRVSLDNNRRDAAIIRAADVASLATSGHLPPVLGLPNEDAAFTQVVDQAGRVVATSANISGEPAVGPPIRPGSGPIVTRMSAQLIGEDNHSGLVAVSAQLAGHPVTVYTAYSLSTSDLAVRDLTLGLIIGIPLLLLVVTGTTWVIVGRALRPIDAIRSEVAEITTHDLHRRVPEPAGRDEVARLARTMNVMLDRLGTSVERQQAFVADASHELRSPLSSLRAQLEVGLARGRATDWPATVADALAEEARIERLVGDLLLLARLDSGHRPTGLVTVDLGAAVDAELSARPSRPDMHVRAETDGRPLIAMSTDLARRVVANLVDNAERHATNEVLITVATKKGKVILSVVDDGPGVAPADRQRIFERFTRLDTSRSSGDGGAGLGLAIVRDIVVRHGGRVEFADVARGACIVVELPAAPFASAPMQNPAGSNRHVGSRPPAPEPMAARGGQKTGTDCPALIVNTPGDQ